MKYQVLGKLLKRKRIQRGLSQGELAELLGIHQASVSRYEHGRLNNVSLSMLNKIRKEFKISADEFAKLILSED